jgi:hypothetical protein
MEYVLLIYGEESVWSSLPPDAQEEKMREYSSFARDLQSEGKLLGSNELHPVATATTIAVRGGDAVVTDGPFGETKEVLGGYFVIEADSLDEAIDWAQRIPDARYGRVEIRPAVDHTGDSS